ncbi:flagellar assembly protein FliX [Roseibium sp. CAU 1637]|uniref:Flagellar assembly protein FliX n=1 Tax=Roseibium limicola TaxID=2816037 RepID=A0A939J8K8_9HYPH|nr:flagellar assembly protein FliX [Roseibium limicola]MBO0344979.1 flagellar assembly protein FliX [Roseibium limicola]
MRINGQSPVTGVQGRGSKKKAGGASGAFTLDSGTETSQAGAMSGSSGIHGMDALLALQEVEEEPNRKRQATQRGHDLLDTLDQLKADLLAGRVSEDRLERLSSRLSDEIDSGDEKVEAVLREIELRAKVELAKLGRFYD